MKKRFFSLLLILALALSLCAAVHADVSRFVYDEDDTISAEDERILEELGARIQADTGVSVCVYIARDRGESDPAAFAERFYSENIGADDGVILVHFFSNEANKLSYYKIGEKLDGLGEEDMMQFLQAYNDAGAYFEGAHSCMNLIYAALGGASAYGEVTPEDNANIPAEHQLGRVADLAGVVGADRLKSLNALADEVSEKYQCDVAVAFVSSLDGRDIVRYSDNFFLDNGYGMGLDRNGILLLISVGDREYNESTHGNAIEAFTDYGITNYLEPNFLRYISNGRDDWAGAAEQFITDAGVLLKQARDGNPYDYSAPQREHKSFRETAPLAALISAVIGFFSGGIPTGAMKRQMKSVEKEYGAANYARGGLNLRARDDRFLYANVSKTRIQRDTEHRSGGGGGGSSVHCSSSGRSHGGSHGKF